MVQNILALDYGEKAIGVALAQEGSEPIPLTTLNGGESSIEHVRDLIQNYAITTIVVGWPRNLEGQSTLQTIRSENFANLLKKFGLSVELQDEALTSQEAIKRLPKKVSPRQAKTLLHQYSAVIILEDYLANHQK